MSHVSESIVYKRGVDGISCAPPAQASAVGRTRSVCKCNKRETRPGPTCGIRTRTTQDRSQKFCARMQVFTEMVFVFGDVHCDPHAANMLVQRGARGHPVLVLLDHGLYMCAAPPHLCCITDLHCSPPLQCLAQLSAASITGAGSRCQLVCMLGCNCCWAEWCCVRWRVRRLVQALSSETACARYIEARCVDVAGRSATPSGATTPSSGTRSSSRTWPPCGRRRRA